MAKKKMHKYVLPISRELVKTRQAKGKHKDKQYKKYWFKVFQERKVIFKSTIQVQSFLKALEVEGDEVKAITTLRGFEAFFIDKVSHLQAKKKLEEERAVRRKMKERKDDYRSVFMQGKKDEYRIYANMVKVKKERNKDKLKELGFL